MTDATHTRLMFVTLNYPPPLIGGSQMYWYQLLTHLDRTAVQTTVLASSKPDLQEVQEFDAQVSFQTIRLPVVFHSHSKPMSKIKRIVLLFKWWQGLRRYLHRETCDVIIMQDIYYLGLFVRLLCKRRKIPYVIATYGEELSLAQQRHSLRTRIRYGIYKHVLQGASGIIAITENTVNLVEAFGPDRSNVTVIYPPTTMPSNPPLPDTVDMWLAENSLQNKQIIFSISRLIERKGYDYLLRAWSQIAPNYPDTVLVIAGDGPERESLQQLAVELEIEGFVRFLGAVSEEGKAILLTVCRFFVMVNRQLSNGDVEGYGIVFNEASSFGKAVIGGNSGGTPEAIVDDYTGILVDGTDEESIASAIIRLLEDPNEAQQMGRRGKAWVLENRSPESAAQQFTQLMSEIAGQNNGIL